MENREIPTADEFICDSKSIFIEDIMIEFAQLHVKLALKAAAENAQVTNEIYKSEVNKGSWYQEHNVDKQSILNAYPLDQIK